MNNTVTHLHVLTIVWAVYTRHYLTKPVVAALSGILSVRHTVVHQKRTKMALYHFTLPAFMVTLKSPNTLSERQTVIHDVRAMMAIHHFTLHVLKVKSTLCNTCYPLVM